MRAGRHGRWRKSKTRAVCSSQSARGIAGPSAAITFCPRGLVALHQPRDPAAAGRRSASMLPGLVAKELCDNALDAADAAGTPRRRRDQRRRRGNLTVEDHGTGIPGATPEQIASLFCVARPMVSSKLLRRPSAGRRRQRAARLPRLSHRDPRQAGHRDRQHPGRTGARDRRHQPHRQRRHDRADQGPDPDGDRRRCTIHRGASGLGRGRHRTGAAVGPARLHRPPFAALVRPRSLPRAAARRGRQYLGPAVPRRAGRLHRKPGADQDRRPVPAPPCRLPGRRRGRRIAHRCPGRDQAAEAQGAASAGPGCGGHRRLRDRRGHVHRRRTCAAAPRSRSSSSAGPTRSSRTNKRTG